MQVALWQCFINESVVTLHLSHSVIVRRIQIGSCICVLKASVVECWLIPSHLDQPSINISMDTCLTLDQQWVNSQLCVDWLICTDQKFSWPSMRCWWSVVCIYVCMYVINYIGKEKLKHCTTELFRKGLVVLSHQVHEILTN